MIQQTFKCTKCNNVITHDFEDMNHLVRFMDSVYDCQVHDKNTGHHCMGSFELIMEDQS